MGVSPPRGCACPSLDPPSQRGLLAGCKQWLLQPCPGEVVAAWKSNCPLLSHLGESHFYCRVSGLGSGEHLRAPKSTCELPKAPASSWLPLRCLCKLRYLSWVLTCLLAPVRPQIGECQVPGGLGTACSRGAPSLDASTGLCVPARRASAPCQRAGSAAWPCQRPHCSHVEMLGWLSAPCKDRAPHGAAGPLTKQHPPSRPVAVQLSRQDAGKSFLLRCSVRMGALLPAELREPVAQLPSLHTCSARLR